MKLSELKPNMKNILLENLEITEISPVREYSRMSGPGKVAQATVKDDSGTAQLTLWNEQCDEFKTGDVINIGPAKTKEWNGQLQISTDFKGKIEKQNL